MAKKRPCRICRLWFYADPRVGDRQRTCSATECQKTRRQKTKADWRRRNPDYFTARRILSRAAKGKTRPEPPSPPPPLDRLPWDIAQDQFGAQGAHFLGVMGGVLVRCAQDQRRAHLIDSTRGSG